MGSKTVTGCAIGCGVLLAVFIGAGVWGLVSPGGKTGSAVTEVELTEAAQKGLVQYEIRGLGGLEAVEARVTRLSSRSLRVFILPGTVFDAGGGTVQSMVVTYRASVLLAEKGKPVTVKVPSACINMHLAVPGSNTLFEIKPAEASSDLAKLTGLPSFQQANFRVRQFAVWTITDNPTRGGYVGIGSFGVGSGPTPDMMAQIKAMFVEAGIDTAKYQALQ